MDKRVYLLTIISFIVGMVELIIGGILDIVAADLGVSISQAGLLITVFSLVFAISAPILLYLAGETDRKKVTLISLIVFSAGNLLAGFGPTFGYLLAARVITAASGSLLVVLCITTATQIVAKEYIGRAYGIVIMGISGSIVLGVPIGMTISHAFTWRTPFLLIAVLSLLLMIVVSMFMGEIKPKPTISVKEQLQTLWNRPIFFAHLTTFLFLAGHYTFYAYFTPFLVEHLGFGGSMLSFAYFLFGIAAVMGGGISGMLADRFNPRMLIILTTCSFALALFLLPHLTFAVPIFLLFIIIWGILNWTLSPPMQRYLIEIAPKSAAIQQSLNNSALHFGIAAGAFVGSNVVGRADVAMTSVVGAIIVLLSLGTALISMTGKKPSQSNV